MLAAPPPVCLSASRHNYTENVYRVLAKLEITVCVSTKILELINLVSRLINYFPIGKNKECLPLKGKNSPRKNSSRRAYTKPGHKRYLGKRVCFFV